MEARKVSIPPVTDDLTLEKSSFPKARAFENPALAFIESSAVLRNAIIGSQILVIGALLIWLFVHMLHNELRLVGTIGFGLDDAWIHMTVARNLVEGWGYGINPGRSVSVSTSPTWTLLLAASYWFFREPVVANLSVCFVCSLVADVLCYFFIRSLTGKGWLGLVGAIVLMFNSIMVWGLNAGMELPLVAAALLGTLYLYHASTPSSKTRLYAVPVALGLAAITRPELFMLIPMAFVDTFSRLREDPETRRTAWKFIAIQTAIVSVTLLPYFALNEITTGILFPTSFYAKTRVRGIGFMALLHYGNVRGIFEHAILNSITEVIEIGNFFVNANLPLFLLTIPGAFALSRSVGTPKAQNGRLIAIAFFVLPFVMGLLAPARHLSNHADRYYIIFPVMGVVLAMLGVNLMIQKTKAEIAAGFCVVLMIFAPLRTYFNASTLLLRDVDSTERLYRQMGEWIGQNIPKDAVLATNDIGGLGYFAKRDFIDIMGLSSPEIWPAIFRGPGQNQDIDKLRQYLKDHKVEYVILCPLYYPALTNDTKTFEPIKEWSERIDHDRLISPQILYKVHW